MAEAVRILHVLGNTRLGGAESRIMDLYRHMDRDRVQFDFLVHTDKEGYFDKEIQSLGGRIFRIPRFRAYNYFSYKRAVRAFSGSIMNFRWYRDISQARLPSIFRKLKKREWR